MLRLTVSTQLRRLRTNSPCDHESPVDELVRTAEEVGRELYYLRSDAACRVPCGVMLTVNRCKLQKWKNPSEPTKRIFVYF